MKDEIKDNIKKIKEEEERVVPSGTGYDFNKENERVHKLERDKKQRKVVESKSQREKRLYMATGVLAAYFILFTAFSTYSIVKIQQNTNLGVERNESIADIDMTKPVLFAGSLNKVKVNVYSIEQEEDVYKVNYSLFNESDKEIGISFNGAYLVREDDANFQPGIQFSTIKEETVGPGEAIQGFMTFYAAEQEDDEETKGYYTVNDKGEVVFVEGTPPSGTKTEEAPKTEDVSKEESTTIDKEKMDVKFALPAINHEGVFEVITEINR